VIEVFCIGERELCSECVDQRQIGKALRLDEILLNRRVLETARSCHRTENQAKLIKLRARKVKKKSFTVVDFGKNERCG